MGPLRCVGPRLPSTSRNSPHLGTFLRARRRKATRSNRFKRKNLLPFQAGIVVLLAAIALLWLKQPGSTCATGASVEDAAATNAVSGFFREQRRLSGSNASNSTLKVICGELCRWTWAGRGAG